MLIDDNSKNFEKPESGMFLGTIIDVVDLGKVATQFGLKAKVRIVWVLDKNDSEGNPFRVIYQATASVNERAKLFEMVKSILGVAPSVPFDAEVLIGRSNQLYIVRETNAVTKKDFASVKVVLPLPAGATPPRAPQGFVRSKDRAAQGVTQVQTQVAPSPQPTQVATGPIPAAAPVAPTQQPASAAPVDAAF